MPSTCHPLRPRSPPETPKPIQVCSKGLKLRCLGPWKRTKMWSTKQGRLRAAMLIEWWMIIIVQNDSAMFYWTMKFIYIYIHMSIHKHIYKYKYIDNNLLPSQKGNAASIWFNGASAESRSFFSNHRLGVDSSINSGDESKGITQIGCCDLIWSCSSWISHVWDGQPILMYTWVCISVIEEITCNMTIYRERGWKKIIRVKEEREGGEEILSPFGRALVPPAAWCKRLQNSQVPSVFTR